MRVTFWGTRGSIPTPGPTTVRYGGNTSCVEMRTADGSLLVFDCGTGAQPLERSHQLRGDHRAHGLRRVRAGGLRSLPDLLADDRFQSRPASATSLGVRFYAGTPLTTSDGFRVGTLCVMDRRPRQLKQNELLALKDLAAVAEELLTPR